MGKIITWTLNNHPPVLVSNETNGLFYAEDVVRHTKFRSSFSIKFCLQNAIRYIVGKQTINVPAGSFFVVNQGTEMECPPCVRGTKAVMAFFTVDLLSDVNRVLASDETALLDDPSEEGRQPEFFEYVYRQPGALLVQLQEIGKKMAGEDQGYDESSHDLFFSLAENLLSLQRNTRRQIDKISASRLSTRKELYRRLLAARAFMYDRWDASLTLEEVAREACLSPYHFHRSFQEAFGAAPMQCFKKIKMEKAKMLLAAGGHSVSEAALCSGFADVAGFSKAFKRECGVSPSQVLGG